MDQDHPGVVLYDILVKQWSLKTNNLNKTHKSVYLQTKQGITKLINYYDIRKCGNIAGGREDDLCINLFIN